MHLRGLIIVFILLLCAQGTLLSAYLTEQKSLRETREILSVAFNGLQKEIGYIGLIHNLKNALLRPDDDSYRIQALDNYAQAKNYVSKIELAGQSIVLKFTLQATKDMLEAYKERLLALPEYGAQGLTITDIDTLIRYDDFPAYDEISRLSNTLFSQLERDASQSLRSTVVLALAMLMIAASVCIAIIRRFIHGQRQALIQSCNINEKLNRRTAQVDNLNSQLMKKNEEMEQFIYTVSHDLKSPLVSISGITQRCTSHIEKDRIQLRQGLERIRSNTEYMNTLLDELLDLSRIISQPIHIAPVSVIDIVNQQVALLDDVVKETNARITMHPPEFKIMANERLLKQAINNLLKNAMQYADVAKAPVIDIRLSKNDTHCNIEVKDNGIGIDKKYHKRIFNIFEKLDPEHGNGVGLTIVKKIMDKHRGSVKIFSSCGEGCTFTLAFPNIKLSSEMKH